MSERRSFWGFARDVWAAHPILDWAAPIAAVCVWWLLAGGWRPGDGNALRSALTVAATVSGMAMAASTFACTMTYNSANILMSEVKKLFSDELKRNWVSVISSNLLTAAVPACALFISSDAPGAAAGAFVGSVPLLATRFLRAVFWLRLTLFMQKAANELPERVEVPMRADLA